MQHIYFNLRALGSCTLFALSFIEDCHVLFIMATKYGREFVAYRNRFAGHEMARKCQNRFIVYSAGYGVMSFQTWGTPWHAMHIIHVRFRCYQIPAHDVQPTANLNSAGLCFKAR